MAYRLVRNIYGFASASVQALNVSLPWEISSGNDGMWAMNKTAEDAERDNLLFWAQTNWGEIPYKFKFGLDARRYIFDQQPFLKEKIENNARAQLNKYFPYLKIVQLKVFTSEEDESLPPNQIRFYLLAETAKGKTIELKQVIGN